MAASEAERCTTIPAQPERTGVFTKSERKFSVNKMQSYRHGSSHSRKVKMRSMRKPMYGILEGLAGRSQTT
jgi:hypothetical protein